MPKLHLTAIPVTSGSTYPAKYASQMDGRSKQSLSQAGGLTQFGANLVHLAPGALSSLRHWHENQDEFLVITAGVCTLIDDHGETELHMGECAAFPAGDANGHHLANRTDSVASFVVVGTYTQTEVGHYSDIDMMVKFDESGAAFTRRDGSEIED